MKKKLKLVILLITLSIVSTGYTLFLIVSFHYTGTGFTSRISKVVLSNRYIVIPIFTSCLGWLIAGYELYAIKKRDISRALKEKIPGRKDKWVIYNTFKGRGGASRLAIMETLNTPKLRSEVADAAEIDWKEVDRNLKILESVDLVRIQFTHGSVSIYELTDKGKEVLQIVKSVVK